MRSTISVFILTLLLIASCNEKKDNTRDELLKKVMAVHDDIMPKMGDLMKYQKQLKAKIDELKEADAEENEAKIEALAQAVKDLENSHEGMMDWMRNFDRNFEDKVEEEVMKYLDDQMTKIEGVGQMTNTALKNAEKLLSE